MARGGKRAGAGRPAGAATKKTREAADAAAADGITPLEYMLKVLRDEGQPDERRMWAAEKAAPFMHPRLNAVDHSSRDGTMSPQPSTIIIEAAPFDDDSDNPPPAEAGAPLQ